MTPDYAHQDTRLSRRGVLCGGGAAIFGAMMVSLLGRARAVRAQPLTRPVPEVDSLAIRVVIDSYQFAVAPSRKFDAVEIQHFGWGIGADKAPGRTLVSEFGLSMFVESQRGAQTRNILVDFGYTSQALLNNAGMLGIEPSRIDALVLSHGHFDHFGGLVGFLREHQSKLRAGLPLYVGGEDCFCAREWTAPPVPGDFGVLDRAALENAHLAVTFTPGPSLVAGHAFTSGQIGLRSFEKLLSPTAMRIGVEHGVGCYPDRLPAGERTRTLVPDQFRHEIATIFNLRGKGLVVLTSCSHRGVVNAIRHAQAISGVKRVHAVIGGFHLAPYPHEYLRQTVAALKEIDPDYVIPLHCSGEPFYEMAEAEIPRKLLRSYTGTRFVFKS